MGVVLSDTESHRGENLGGNEEGSEIERRIATFLDDDTVSAQVKDAFSSQVLLNIVLLFSPSTPSSTSNCFIV